MSDRTSDGRPPRKAGAAKSRGNFGAGRGGAGKGRPDKGGPRSGPGKGGAGGRGGRPAFDRAEGGSRNFGDKRRDATSGERPITGRNKDERSKRSVSERRFDDRKPGGGRAEGASRDYPKREGRSEGRPFRERSAEGKGFEGRKFEGRPSGERKPSERTFRDRDGDRPRRARSEGDGKFGARAQGDRPHRPPRRDEDAPRRGGRFVRSNERPAADTSDAQGITAAHGGGRIAKVIARAGACSRRDAEAWITEGRVAVNGTVLDSPAFNVGPDDKITIDGKPLASRERTRLFLFHKPRGLVTTNSDPEGRPTIFDALPDDVPRLVSVGRLDINTEGLLLLTNDGGLARVLELPATGWLRRYRVRAHGEVNQAQLDALAKGVVIEGVEYRGIEAHLDRVQGANVWLTMGLREGKNREVRKIMAHLGVEVNRLIRISFGPFQLLDLKPGEADHVRRKVLIEQLGPKLAKDLGIVEEDEESSASRAGKTTAATRRFERRKAQREHGDE